MSNADMPASPVQIQFGKAYHKDFDGNGLTKREYFAGLAMQALSTDAESGFKFPEQIASRAVALADLLLEELEK